MTKVDNLNDATLTSQQQGCIMTGDSVTIAVEGAFVIV